ncbi:MAG TPA: hypothetical protein VMK12_01835 [Anaeromyxobacteraceae bacterium]|nr:hypothetical protein [Anaeromyxobacteraceae bacterium]
MSSATKRAKKAPVAKNLVPGRAVVETTSQATSNATRANLDPGSLRAVALDPA